MGFVDRVVELSIDTVDRCREIEVVTAIPGKWADLLVRAGLVDPRREGQIPSLRQLASAAELTPTTVGRIVLQGRSATPENMQKIARALRIPLDDLYLVAKGVEARPLQLPPGTENLSLKEKEAVLEIIRVLVDSKEHKNAEIVDKKKTEPAEPEQEKTAGVTPIGGRRKLTPLERQFEAVGRKAARIRQGNPEGSHKIDPDMPKKS